MLKHRIENSISTNIKLIGTLKKSELPVTTGQVNYEVGHLLVKLEKRDSKKV